MNSSRFVALLWLLVWLGAPLKSLAQSSADLHKQFAATKARAEQGDAQAQLRLASCYSDGTGVSKDLRKAANWLRKAAEQGVPRAQFFLALAYSDGRGVKTNAAEAVYWLMKAAQQGMVEAELELGSWYSRGQNVSENPVEAVTWFRRAAEQNSPEANYRIGQCYLQGVGVPKELPEAVQWTTKAAVQGFAPAQNTLGLCYLNGDGLAKDYVQAYKWFNLAAAQGDPETYDFRVNLAKAASFLTADQVAQAQRLALQFKPDNATQIPSLQSSPEANPSSSSTPGTEAIPQTGWLQVNAADQAAEIFVDRAFVGNTPAKLKLDPGTHLIEVKRSGFKDYRRQISLKPGSELTLNAALQPD